MDKDDVKVRLIDRDCHECEYILDEAFIWASGLDIQIDDAELEDIYNIKELTQLIIKKIDRESSDTDTYQLTFNKLKKAFTDIGVAGDDKITSETTLKQLMPWRKRKKIAKALNEKLSFDVTVISSSCIFYILSIILGIGSIIMLFFDLKLGLLGIAMSGLIFYINFKLGRSLCYKNIGELTDYLVRYRYLQIRGDNTVNYPELERLIYSSFQSIENDYESKE